jgi:uncharacterized protein (UPF0333 family)
MSLPNGPEGHSSLPPWTPTAPVGPRRWLPLAIVVAAIVLAAAIVAAAIILSGGTRKDTSDSSATVSTSAITSNSVAATSSTCNAWRTTKPALDAIPGLPVGWDWNTPGIDTYIANRNAAIARALNIFESKIAPEPSNIAATAHDYVSAKRTEMQKLSDHTYTAADGVPGNTALATLNQLCGIG